MEIRPLKRDQMSQLDFVIRHEFQGKKILIRWTAELVDRPTTTTTKQHILQWSNTGSSTEAVGTNTAPKILSPGLLLLEHEEGPPPPSLLVLVLQDPRYVYGEELHHAFFFFFPIQPCLSSVLIVAWRASPKPGLDCVDNQNNNANEVHVEKFSQVLKKVNRKEEEVGGGEKPQISIASLHLYEISVSFQSMKRKTHQ